MVAKGETAVKDYRLRRGELSAYGRALNSSQHLLRLYLLVGAVVGGIVLIVLLRLPVATTGELRVVLSLALLVLLVGLPVVWFYTRRHFIEPDLAFRKWLQQVCDGDLDARIDLPEQHRHYKELNFHTRNLASALMRLSTDMEQLVEDQTERLARQTRVMELLLRLTSEVSGESQRREVLKTVGRYLADWFGNAVVSGYLLEGNTINKVASAVSTSETEPQVSAQALAWQSPVITPQAFVTEVTYDDPPDTASPATIRLPFFAGVNVAGMVVIEVLESSAAEKAESLRILTAVSEQLTLFVNKKLARDQVQQVRMIDERTRLAADIHDSLAQTLLAARYKASLLRDSFAVASTDDNTSAYTADWLDEVTRLEATIGEANQEVRELIREYRSPLSEHRSVDSIQLAIEQFRTTSGMPVFFQCDSPNLRFTPREESVVQRIILEALTNTEKYAKDSTVRVLLQFQSDGKRTILIEDDGPGFTLQSAVEHPSNSTQDSGEHIGLSIMRERAIGIGAIFGIDSELGEGTRVSLMLPPLIEAEPK